MFAALIDPARLLTAARRTARDKRSREAVARWWLDRHAHLARLRRRLIAETWQPAPFVLTTIRDPKPRIIACAPFGDRVLHTALVELLSPLWAQALTRDDFASRPGYGTHRAVLRLRALMHRHRFVVHLDVRAYFASIDCQRLLRLIRKRVRDRRSFDVITRIVDEGRAVYAHRALRDFAGLTTEWPPPGRGLPIGASTSQFFAAHVYLNAFDHWVKRSLRVGGYLRYCDDLFVFGDRRADLRTWRGAIGAWLMNERGLRPKHPNARVLSCAGRLDGLGHRIRRDGHQALPRARRRLQRRVREALSVEGAAVDLKRSIVSSTGVLCF